MYYQKQSLGALLLLFWSSAIISEANQHLLRKLKRNQKNIEKKIDHVIELLEPEESGVGPVVFKISIKNEMNQNVMGRIVYEDNVHHAEQYTVPAFNIFKEKITPPEPIIKNVTGVTESGVICDPYEHDKDDDPKLKFHIVAKDDEGCIILPAKEQYHPIRQFSFYENKELVKQEDFFNPGTGEAVLKVAAHGNNPETTMIFQTSKSTKKRRNAGYGIMITANEKECHITELPDELNIDPDHMRLNMMYEEEVTSRKTRTVDNNIKKYHVVKHFQNTVIISKGDDLYKNLSLTSDQEALCEGKHIFYNSEHIVIKDEDYTLGISSIKEEDLKKYQRVLDSTLAKSTIDKIVEFPCTNATYKYSNDAQRACGVWTYTGIDSTSGNEPANPFTNWEGRHIYTGTWQVIAGCCEDEPNDSSWFPCDKIKEGAGDEAEQIFSTAFYLSWRFRGFSCPGKSKFCQAEEDSDLYKDWGVKGACTSTCTECCSLSNNGQKNACPKSYGWYWGFYKNACSKAEYTSG